jgi:hypothetical protein
VTPLRQSHAPQSYSHSPNQPLDACIESVDGVGSVLLRRGRVIVFVGVPCACPLFPASLVYFRSLYRGVATYYPSLVTLNRSVPKLRDSNVMPTPSDSGFCNRFWPTNGKHMGGGAELSANTQECDAIGPKWRQKPPRLCNCNQGLGECLDLSPAVIPAVVEQCACHRLTVLQSSLSQWDYC